MNMEDTKEVEEIQKVDLEDTQGLQDGFKRIPPWTKQITVRGLFASFIIGVVYSIIVMKLNLTTGLVPNLNVSAALLAFVFLRTWTKILHKAGIVTTPFTRQENTVIQTCAVACYSIAVGGWMLDIVNLVKICILFYHFCLFLLIFCSGLQVDLGLTYWV